EWQRLITQTATPCPKSGGGGPNVAPFIDPVPTRPMTSQTGFVLASHPERQSFSDARGSTGKLCEVPVQPRSRSEPTSFTLRCSSVGPPAWLGQQAASQMPARKQTSLIRVLFHPP